MVLGFAQEGGLYGLGGLGGDAVVVCAADDGWIFELIVQRKVYFRSRNSVYCACMHLNPRETTDIGVRNDCYFSPFSFLNESKSRPRWTRVCQGLQSTTQYLVLATILSETEAGTYLLINTRIEFLASVESGDSHIAFPARLDHARFVREVSAVAARYDVLYTHTLSVSGRLYEGREELTLRRGFQYKRVRTNWKSLTPAQVEEIAGRFTFWG